MSTWHHITVMPDTADTHASVHPPNDDPSKGRITTLKLGPLTLQFGSHADAAAWVDHCAAAIRQLPGLDLEATT